MDTEEKAQSIARRIVGELLMEADEGRDLEAVRVRTYSDAEAYALLDPQGEQETWSLHQAINRHLAAGFEEYGIVVEFVVLSTQEYRRWLRDRSDSPGMRDRYSEIMENALPVFTSEPRTLH